ncbi:hypothetical protein [Bartonella quintana]|uniref:Uncharacterized protein n=2 Tax=Bartonella quintana TaxID=803 RepID=A0A0H3M049_BARQU|nr:hypothetical protein [Bartonella quintana]QUG71689.1 hypothetical protein FOL54_00540 [Bartonella quintana]CAF25869.1 hypothetical protein BQ03690 [Bartonella quintana str. Toulouse]
MKKLLKNYGLSILIASAFSLSQVANVHATHLRNSPQTVNTSVSVIEQGKKQAINMAALYVPSLNHEAENEAAFEGKVEKVAESITLGNFGIGMLAGYGTGTISIFLGWIVSKIIAAIKGS